MDRVPLVIRMSLAVLGRVPMKSWLSMLTLAWDCLDILMCIILRFLLVIISCVCCVIIVLFVDGVSLGLGEITPSRVE